MALKTSDLFIVQRGIESYKMSASQLKNFTGTAPSPTPPTSPGEGDLWFDLNSGLLFVWNGSEWEVVGNQGDGSGSTDRPTARVYVDDVPPTDHIEGDLWYASDDGNLYVWYVDETEGLVADLTLNRGGKGYSSGSRPTSGGSGHGLVVDITVDGEGAITAATVNDPGHGYEDGDQIYIGGSFTQVASFIATVNGPTKGQWITASPGLSDGTETVENFPELADPVAAVGQEYVVNGITYTWDGEKWRAGSTGGGASVHVGETPPTEAVGGDLWWNSEEGILYIYYEDVDTSQWVQAAGSPNPDLSSYYTKTESDTNFVNAAGDLMTGTLSSTEREITASEFDLARGNYFFVNSAIDIPTPINGVAGTNGVIKFADGAAPTSWAAEFKFPTGTPFEVSGETILPFYVKAANEILVGYPTGDF